jgi:hypothetical protein
MPVESLEREPRLRGAQRVPQVPARLQVEHAVLPRTDDRAGRFVVDQAGPLRLGRRGGRGAACRGTVAGRRYG